MAGPYLKDPVPPLDLGIPPGKTCTVRVIDSTSMLLDLKTGFLFDPTIEGHDAMTCPAYSILITHDSKHYLFDLGVRKDFEQLPPALWQRIQKIMNIRVDKNVAEILEEDREVGVKPKDIDTVIWSHHHFDHIGDMSTFPKTTSLVVGPGFREKYLPGYPENPDGVLHASDFEDRKVTEIEFSGDLKFGSSPAHDFFGDGSLYLLDTPGHTVGHLCGLVRTSKNPDTFVLMGGDACHYAGEFRPTKYLPLPKTVVPSALPKIYPNGCPGELLEKIKKPPTADTEFYSVKESFSEDHGLAEMSIRKVQELDAQDNVLTIIAHDESLLRHIPLFPQTINDWHSQSVHTKNRWRFTEDFSIALEKAIKS